MAHDHNHSCCCGHEHKHEHGHDCCKQHHQANMSELSQAEQEFLANLAQYQCLPVAQFVVKSSKESDFETVALAPVFITQTTDTMQQVKNFGKKLKNLEEKGFIELDYDIPIDNYDYSEYHNSQLFEYFKATVEEGKGKDNFLGDIAVMQTGSMVLAQNN